MPPSDTETLAAPLDRFGSSLRAWRDLRGLSQAGLARQLHVHRDLIAKIERGRRCPTHDLVLRCDEILGTGGELPRLWPEVESDRARRRLLAAHERVAQQLQEKG